MKSEQCHGRGKREEGRVKSEQRRVNSAMEEGRGKMEGVAWLLFCWINRLSFCRFLFHCM